MLYKIDLGNYVFYTNEQGYMQFMQAVDKELMKRVNMMNKVKKTEFIVLEDITTNEGIFIPAGTVFSYDPAEDVYTSIEHKEDVSEGSETVEYNEIVVTGDILEPYMNKLQSTAELEKQLVNELNEEKINEKFDEILEETKDKVMQEGPSDSEDRTPEGLNETPLTPEEVFETAPELYTFDLVQICPDGEEIVLKHFDDVDHNGLSIIITSNSPIELECPKSGLKMSLAIRMWGEKVGEETSAVPEATMEDKNTK